MKYLAIIMLLISAPAYADEVKPWDKPTPSGLDFLKLLPHPLTSGPYVAPSLEDQVEDLEDEVNSLRNKVRKLEQDEDAE